MPTSSTPSPDRNIRGLPPVPLMIRVYVSSEHGLLWDVWGEGTVVGGKTVEVTLQE